MKKYRLKQKSYIFEDQEEDGCGSTKDVVQSAGNTCSLWSGECEMEPDAKFFADIGIEMPANDSEERGGDPDCSAIGDAEYSYVLDVLIDGKWKRAKYIDRIQCRSSE